MEETISYNPRSPSGKAVALVYAADVWFDSSSRDTPKPEAG